MGEIMATYRVAQFATKIKPLTDRFGVVINTTVGKCRHKTKFTRYQIPTWCSLKPR